MENKKESKLNSEKIWKVWKKNQLNSEKIWKIWKKSHLNIEMFNLPFFLIFQIISIFN
jgi:hypothetical protein